MQQRNKNPKQPLKLKWKIVIAVIVFISLSIPMLILPYHLWYTSDNLSRGISAIRGTSMSPTLKDNAIVYLKPITEAPKRGDIVVTECPPSEYYSFDKDSTLIKRIVGLPGEIVEITEKGIKINQNTLDESNYLSDDVRQKTKDDTIKYQEVILSNNEYFLVGDNRGDSFDSRHFGPVPGSLFKYQVTAEPNEYSSGIMRQLKITYTIHIFVIILLPFILFFTIYTTQVRKQKKALKEQKHSVHETTHNK